MDYQTEVSQLDSRSKALESFVDMIMLESRFYQIINTVRLVLNSHSLLRHINKADKGMFAQLRCISCEERRLTLTKTLSMIYHLRDKHLLLINRQKELPYFPSFLIRIQKNVIRDMDDLIEDLEIATDTEIQQIVIETLSNPERKPAKNWKELIESL